MDTEKHDTGSRAGGAAGAVLMILLPLIKVLAVFVVCFGPAIGLGFLFRTVFRKCVPEHPDTRWCAFWAVCAVLSLAAAGALGFHDILWVRGKMNLDAKIFTIHGWTSFMIVAGLITLPLVQLFTIQLGRVFRKLELEFAEEETGEHQVLNIISGVNIIAYWGLIVLLNQLSFIILGFKVRKITWIVSGVLYLIPIIVLTAGWHHWSGWASLGLMFLISLIHAKVVSEEYYMNTPGNVVYILK